MKRLAILVVTGMMAAMLTACGKPAPKKPEAAPQAPASQTEQQPAAGQNSASADQNAASADQVQE